MRGGDRDLFPKMFCFLYVCAKTICLVRFLRIHPVQSVINNPTQLSGRGFSYIFILIVFCRNFTFFGTPKWKSGRAIRKFWILRNVAEKLFVCASRMHSVQSLINSRTQLSGRGFSYIFYMKLVLSQHYVVLVLRNGSRAVYVDILKL